jgi:hypothetical protein
VKPNVREGAIFRLEDAPSMNSISCSGTRWCALSTKRFAFRVCKFPGQLRARAKRIPVRFTTQLRWATPYSVYQASLSRVTANPFSSLDINPRRSPDGNWIVFTRLKLSMLLPRNFRPPVGVPAGVSALFLVHPDGTGRRQLTKWGVSADLLVPGWQHDRLR